MRFVTLLIASVVLISLPTLSFAQDIGEKDTLWFEYPSDWTILPGCENELAVELWFWTDNSVYGTCLGFKAQTSGEEGVWGPFVDTNLVIDTFIVEPEVKAKAPLTIKPIPFKTLSTITSSSLRMNSTPFSIHGKIPNSFTNLFPKLTRILSPKNGSMRKTETKEAMPRSKKMFKGSKKLVTREPITNPITHAHPPISSNFPTTSFTSLNSLEMVMRAAK